jgi:hypothetical protein
MVLIYFRKGKIKVKLSPQETKLAHGDLIS